MKFGGVRHDLQRTRDTTIGVYQYVSGRGNRHVVARGKTDLRLGHDNDATGGTGRGQLYCAAVRCGRRDVACARRDVDVARRGALGN